MKDILYRISSVFVIIIDETGYSESVDVGKIKVIGLSTFNGDEIKVHVKKCWKKSSMVCCICADEIPIKPGVAIPRKTIELDFYEIGYISGEACIMN